MNDDGITIRQARPTREEGLAFGRFVDEVTEGGFRIALGRNVVEILAKAFVVAGHDSCYENTLFAYRDGTIVAMASGFSSEAHTASSDEPLALAPGNRMRRRIGMAILRGRWGMMGRPRPGEFYVEFLIVDAVHRGKGIGALLMDAMETRGHGAGFSHITLHVAAKNTGGRRFYERRGMVYAPDQPGRRYSRRFVLYMTKPLSA